MLVAPRIWEHHETGPHFQGQETYPKELLRQRFRVNFLVRFASKPLFYWLVPSNCSENSLVLFVRLFGFGVLFSCLTLFKGPLALAESSSLFQGLIF